MARISPERKEAILKKLFSSNNQSISQLAKAEGISKTALYRWKQELLAESTIMPNSNKSPENWSSSTKFAIVVETMPLTETELSEYCREKGLYPEQVKRWKSACIEGNNEAKKQSKIKSSEIKAHKKQIQQLEREIHRKDKALAETAALLVLRKKLNALWEEESVGD